MHVASQSMLWNNYGSSKDSEQNNGDKDVQEFICTFDFSSVTFDDEIHTPDSTDVSAEDHGKVQMNVGILQFIENVQEICCEQEQVHDLS
tara:strand:+ start:642 stop:911 length:270 start_codon:yes stop_codon:yes gene_type:complete